MAGGLPGTPYTVKVLAWQNDIKATVGMVEKRRPEEVRKALEATARPGQHCRAVSSSRGRAGLFPERRN
jgi:hypothetical protein